MTLRLLASLLVAGLAGMPAASHADDRSLRHAADRYEEAVEDLYDAVRKSRVDGYTVRLVKSLERLADDFEEATEDRKDARNIQHRFHELLAAHNRVSELLAQPYAIQGERMTRAVRDVDMAWHDVTQFFVSGPHPSLSPHPHPPLPYDRGYGAVYEPLPPPPARRAPHYGYRVAPGFHFEFGGPSDHRRHAPPSAHGWDPHHGGHRLWDAPHGYDKDDYEDYVEDLEERAEEAREHREEQLEEWRERREEALEEQRERYEDYFDDDRRSGPLRRFLDRL